MTELERYQTIYANPVKFPDYGHTNHGEKALPTLLKWKPSSVVDVGCGWNEFVRAVRAKLPGINAVGVDFACPASDVQSAATALPFADKSFDVVTSFDTLEHLLPEEVDLALAEMARVSHRFIFSICYKPSMYEVGGEALHPSVHGEAWWIMRILRAGGVAIEKQGKFILGKWAKSVIRMAPDTRVLVVGNGPSLLSETHGEKIDGFDEVIRFNQFRLRGMEAHVGSKTTLWSTNGEGKLPGDDGPPPKRMLITSETKPPTYEPEELYRLPRWFYDHCRNACMARSSWLHGFESEYNKILPTSGLMITAWLLQVIGLPKVWIAGFDHFQKQLSKQHHYWNPQGYKRPQEHDGDAEAGMFAELLAAGRISYL